MLRDTFALYVHKNLDPTTKSCIYSSIVCPKQEKLAHFGGDLAFIVTEPSIFQWSRLRFKVQVLELSEIIILESCMVAGHYGLIYGA